MFPLDRSLFFVINHGLKSSVNDLWLGYATWLGNGWIAFPLALIVLFTIDRKSFWSHVLLLAIAGTIGGVALNLIKHAVHAPRPLTVFASDIAMGRTYINVLFEKLYWDSFPSGHSQTAFSVAAVLVWVRKRSFLLQDWGSVAIYTIAALVPISRIYCGAHFPSDVVAGTAIGLVSSQCSCWAFDRWQRRRLNLNARTERPQWESI